MLNRRFPAAPAHVCLFATWLADLLVPQAGLDTHRLPDREGLSVHFPRKPLKPAPRRLSNLVRLRDQPE